MRRRDFVKVVTGSVATWPLSARAIGSATQGRGVDERRSNGCHTAIVFCSVRVEIFLHHLIHIVARINSFLEQEFSFELFVETARIVLRVNTDVLVPPKFIP